MAQGRIDEEGAARAEFEDGSFERRSAPRFTLLIRSAKLIADGREFLCVIRDASAMGIKLRMFHKIPEHNSLEIELGSGDRHPVKLVWSTEEYAGLSFSDDIAVERLLDESNGAFPRRQVRLRIALEANVHSGGETVHVDVRDISQQGACVECDKWLLKNELVRLDTGILPPIYAKVRWRNAPRYGLIFEQTFRLDELARLAAPAQFREALAASIRPPDQALGEPVRHVG